MRIGVRLRPWLFRAHLVLGLTVGLWFVLMGLTGSLLVFVRSWQPITEPSPVTKPNPERPCLSLSQAMARIREQLPDVPEKDLARIQLPTGSNAPYRLQIGEHSAVTTVREALADRCTGTILQNKRLIDTPAGFLLLLHLYLLLGLTGERINGVLGIVTVGLLLSGIALRWPPTVTAMKAVFAFPRNASLRRQLHEWHYRTGLLALPVLLLIVGTGISIVFREELQPILFAMTRTPPPTKPPPIVPSGDTPRLPAERLLKIAAQIEPSASIERIVYPTRPDAPLVVRKSRGETGLLSRIQITLDPYTGQVLQIEDERTAPIGRKIVRSLTRLHFGWWGGSVSQVVYALAGGTPLLLMLTGAVKYAERRKARASKRRTNAPPVADTRMNADPGPK
ncbi:MAG: PepSY-associated TM helix domain-containing protein [Capsulimonadales bacterium]|nr:PepSY-associated TM helix domain-containing protein [Capsulimonadales bacterium]